MERIRPVLESGAEWVFREDKPIRPRKSLFQSFSPPADQTLLYSQSARRDMSARPEDAPADDRPSPDGRGAQDDRVLEHHLVFDDGAGLDDTRPFQSHGSFYRRVAGDPVAGAVSVTGPLRPSILHACLLGMAIGLIAFVGPSVVRAAVNPVVCGRSSVEGLAGTRVLAVIPRVGTPEMRIHSRRRLLVNASLALAASATLASVVVYVAT